MAATKRKFHRVQLVYYLLVFKRTSGTLVGNVVDITEEGMQVMARTPLTPGTVYRLRMILPTKGGKGSREIGFEATCVWARKHAFSGFCAAGMRFEGLAIEHVALVRDVIQQFAYPSAVPKS